MKLTSIITVNFNQPGVTIAFLNSIKENAKNDNVEVVLVDNGCDEDHEAEFKKAFPELVFVRSDYNLGFAGGNNLGIEYAKGDYLLLLNNDTEITENLISELTTELENNPEIGLISPMILYFDNPDIIQYAGFTKMNYLTCRNAGIGSMDVNKGQYNNDSRETAFCHGAAMMCRSSDLKQVGLMEEHYFLYYEELDWCEKFRRAGKKIWFTGKTKIYHKESMSVGKESAVKTYFMTRNRMLFIRRNTSALNTLLFSIYYIFIACGKQMLNYILKGRSDLAGWTLKGIFWNFTNANDSQNLGFKLKKTK
ncbi:glycosyltransferase family 2 protein [Mucilaginibacter corticis]|uniref:Glycosyltransferase family 2 protein n=1 Tax=Mucilaginibacter corticis TaxID=2597670 RepID=A0A556MLF0_9SPHI|nr:glycosyltransferase family 2 protein [Mucilaginibacter corticis]TSJ40754.1 glycosyltransferase family 2 protein [Mucilaginibacter corticis]